MTVKISYYWDSRSWDISRGVDIEHIDLETVETIGEGYVSLESYESLYLVSFFSEEETIFYVTDKRDEANQLFKGTLAYLLYSYLWNRYDDTVFDQPEVKEAEKVLIGYDFPSDMKNVFELLEELGGKASREKIIDSAKAKYPHYSDVFVETVLDVLEAKGYAKTNYAREEPFVVFSVVKKLDF